MPPLSDETSRPDSLQALPAAASTVRIPKTRQSLALIEDLPSSPSDASLPSRRHTSAFPSTLSPATSRPHSPVERGSPARGSSASLFEHGAYGGALEGGPTSSGEPLDLIIKSHVPYVAVYASQDTEALAREKGFQDGLWKLLRPFGERVQGKVTVRDSNGFSKSFDDFAIRFVKFGDGLEQLPSVTPGSQSSEQMTPLRVEALVDRHLSIAEQSFPDDTGYPATLLELSSRAGATSPYYLLYLRRLLCGLSPVPYETFAHPVACIITISSRSKTPIDELRRLYEDTNGGNARHPAWVDGDYLRYYVLVHDEERDEISRSMSLFDQMKRHFGLHCHLLRLRSTRSAKTDDDSIPLPHSEWITASEELSLVDAGEGQGDIDSPTAYIFESDATAIRSFVREMVTQSIIPTMERHVSVWNDQVASRRRGIAGRFMSFSRKWAGLGSGSRSSVIASPASGSANYDALGFYRADTPEAIMRRLADFSFMLRDWKLAYSTYDLLRSDFSDAKAWKYHAAVNEMAAVSLLITPQVPTSKSRVEAIDQMLEAAFYSYKTRCGHPYGALRSLLVGMELLKLRGGSCIDHAVRWGMRLLESKLVGPVGDALVKERLAIFCANKQSMGGSTWGFRRRKSAAWSVLAAESWANQDKYVQAKQRLNDAQDTYATIVPRNNGIMPFSVASDFMARLQVLLDQKLRSEDSEAGPPSDAADEESEALGGVNERRPSMVGRVAMSTSNLETAPLHGDDAASMSVSGSLAVPTTEFIPQSGQDEDEG